MLHQLADPFGILHVRLSARHVLEMPGVKKPQLEVIFEHVVDRLPVDACGLHAHQRNCKRGEPVPQVQKPSGGSGELPNLLVRLTPFTRSPHARGDRGLVHIQPRTPFDDPFQPFSLLLRGTLCVAKRSLFH
jgi:hypothetical protein